MLMTTDPALALTEEVPMYADRRGRDQLDHELRLAARVQMGLLPAGVPEDRAFDLAVHYRPRYQLGGDYYDFIRLRDDCLGIAIGDVCGKSIPAALLMASAGSTLRAHAERMTGASRLMTRLNKAICRDAPGDEFVTLFYGVLDIHRPGLTYTNAGHSPPVLVRDGQASRLNHGGLILGVQPDARYRQGRHDLCAGDVLLFYTDGITDTHGPSGELLGWRRLAEVAAANAHQPASGILTTLRGAVDAFADSAPPIDDQTLIVLKIGSA